MNEFSGQAGCPAPTQVLHRADGIHPAVFTKSRTVGPSAGDKATSVFAPNISTLIRVKFNTVCTSITLISSNHPAFA